MFSWGKIPVLHSLRINEIPYPFWHYMMMLPENHIKLNLSSSCDQFLKVTDSSYGNNLLQCRVRLHIIDPMWCNPFLGSYFSGSFVPRVAHCDQFQFYKVWFSLARNKIISWDSLGLVDKIIMTWIWTCWDYFISLSSLIQYRSVGLWYSWRCIVYYTIVCATYLVLEFSCNTLIHILILPSVYQQMLSLIHSKQTSNNWVKLDLIIMRILFVLIFLCW